MPNLARSERQDANDNVSAITIRLGSLSPRDARQGGIHDKMQFLREH